MTEPTLPGLAAIPPVRDELDRRYTPQSLADAIVDRLYIGDNVLCPTVLEPSVGGGAFVRAVRHRWPDAEVMGVDIDADAPGFHGCDVTHRGTFLHVDSDYKPLGSRIDLIIGNPPFGQALEHVRHALTFGCPVVFILPLAYLGVQAWAPLLTGPKRPAFVWPIVGRPWPEHVRECAVFGWEPTREPFAETTLALLTEWQR